MPRLQFHAYVDVERRILTDAAGDPLGGDQLLQFFREEVGVICFHCFNADGSVHPFLVTDAFECGLASDWDQTTQAEIVSEDAQFNIAGDWGDMDPTAGLLSCRYNTNTAGFNTLFAANADQANVGLYLKQIDPIEGNVTLCQYDAIARNIRRTDGATPPAVEAPTYPTYAQVLVLLATTFQGAWAAGTTYTAGQTVSYGGGFFLARRESTGSTPDVTGHTLDWALMAQPGADANTILSGAGAPAAETGVDDDWYIDTTAHYLYGPKTAGAWGTGLAMLGADGNTIHTVSGAPSVLTGVDGDYAIDPTAQLFYGPKAGGLWPAGVSIRGETGPSEWTSWTNDDMDEGTETLAEWDAPTAPGVWKAIGQIGKAGNLIAFEALVALCVEADGYGGYTYTAVALTVQHTTEIGDCSPITWQSGGVLYTDYDPGTGKVRLRVNLAAGATNWSASGKWMRAA